MQLRRYGRCVLAFAIVAAATLATADLIIDGTTCDSTDLSNTNYPSLYAIQTQQDFDSTFSQCTTIIGTVYIGANYVGSFSLNNVTNVTGSIATWAVMFGEAAYLNPDGWPGDNFSVPLLTSIEADSLISLAGVVLPTIPALKSLSMASLESVGESITIYSNPALSLSFPQLRNVTNIQILGGYESLNMDQLVTVEHSMYIGVQNDTIEDNSIFNYDEQNLLDSPSIDINFPSLVSAPYISLWGSISSLSMPNLATLVPPTHPDPELNWLSTGIIIQNFGASLLNVTLPNLWNTTQLSIAGNLNTVFFPSLKTLLGSITLYPYNNVSINFTPLQAADSISIRGNATSANLTSVKNLWTLNIETDGPFNSCIQLNSEWSRMNHTILPFQSALDPIDGQSFECTDVPAPALPFHLSKGVGIGIGVGVGVTVLALCFWVGKCVMRKRRASKKGKEKMRRQINAFKMEILERREREGRDEEDMDVDMDIDLPPEYTPALGMETDFEGDGRRAERNEMSKEFISLNSYEGQETGERVGLIHHDT